MVFNFICSKSYVSEETVLNVEEKNQTNLYFAIITEEEKHKFVK